MNKVRLIEIAEWLEGGAKHANIKFDMQKGLVITEEALAAEDPVACGTVCCIAGAAVAFNRDVINKHRLFGELNYYARDENGEYTKREVNWERVREQGRDALGLTDTQASQLFMPPYLSKHNDPARAARVVRKLIKTGKVDWEGTP